MLAQRGQQVKGLSANEHRGGNLKMNGIDLKISSHSIFELNCGMKSPKRNDFSDTAVSDQRFISTLSTANASRPPFTTTLLPSKGCGQVLSHTSPTSVTHRDSLDLLSTRYANLITGEIIYMYPRAYHIARNFCLEKIFTKFCHLLSLVKFLSAIFDCIGENLFWQIFL